MVRILGIAMFVFAASAQAHLGAPTDFIDDSRAGEEVDLPLSWGQTEKDVRAKLSQSKSRAFYALETAEKKVKATDAKALLKKMYASLAKAEVVFPSEGKDFWACGENVLAFVKVRYDGKIYICSETAYDENAKVDYLAQTIVHESAHTIGIGDECQATKIEVATMRLSPIGLMFENGYWERCGIK